MMKVLHVLETSWPCSAGYTIRAGAIVDYQRRLGLRPVVVTSPLFAANGTTQETHDGVRYYRTNHIASPSSARTRLGSYALRMVMLARYRKAVLEIARRERVDIVHAHSSYTNGWAALPAADRLDVPLVYEVRTLWGESAVVEDGLRPDSWKHKLIWQLELAAMRRADTVVPIARGIAKELALRGIPQEKMRLVPNGVDSRRFAPMPCDEARARSVGLGGCFVIGFIGSIRRLEGLSTLLEAYSMCRFRRGRLGLVIVGDGPDRPALEAQARKQGINAVVFTGSVPHKDVASWYSIMDVLVYPRVRAVINERVTPLKPLEAMALGKVCVGSDVGGLMELIRDGDTGVIFRSGDAEDLAARLISLMDDRQRRQRLQQSALEFVRKERDWSVIVPRYLELYERLIRARGRSAADGADKPAFSRGLSHPHPHLPPRSGK
jgi:PEP-CTERM/exosortase A-associated glycosyltransferase